MREVKRPSPIRFVVEPRCKPSYVLPLRARKIKPGHRGMNHVGQLTLSVRSNQNLCVLTAPSQARRTIRPMRSTICSHYHMVPRKLTGLVAVAQLNVNSDSDEPQGFDGLASLVLTLPELGPRTLPSKALAPTAPSPSASLAGHHTAISQSIISNTAAVAFVLAFILTSVVLAIIPFGSSQPQRAYPETSPSAKSDQLNKTNASLVPNAGSPISVDVPSLTSDPIREVVEILPAQILPAQGAPGGFRLEAFHRRTGFEQRPPTEK
jgi:hypothetical protein